MIARAAREYVRCLEDVRALSHVRTPRWSPGSSVKSVSSTAPGFTAPSFTSSPPPGEATLGRHRLREGDVVTLDGESGLIYSGEVPVVATKPIEALAEIERWKRPPVA